MNVPTGTAIYKRKGTGELRCVVRTNKGKPAHKPTGCHHRDTAEQFAKMLQRHISKIP